MFPGGSSFFPIFVPKKKRLFFLFFSLATNSFFQKKRALARCIFLFGFQFLTPFFFFYHRGGGFPFLPFPGPFLSKKPTLHRFFPLLFPWKISSFLRRKFPPSFFPLTFGARGLGFLPPTPLFLEFPSFPGIERFRLFIPPSVSPFDGKQPAFHVKKNKKKTFEQLEGGFFFSPPTSAQSPFLLSQLGKALSRGRFLSRPALETTPPFHPHQFNPFLGGRRFPVFLMKALPPFE